MSKLFDAHACPFEVVTTSQGKLSIRDMRVGEILHNPLGPEEESKALYISPSALADRFARSPTSVRKEVCIYDVGLGAGINALAALDCFAASQKKSRLHMISFENDLGLAHFSLKQAQHFPWIAKYASSFEELLTRRRIETDTFTWELKLGDFNDEIQSVEHPAEVIFHDPYSPQKNPSVWTTECFRQVFKASLQEPPYTQLLTYSRATPVRVALLLAGFFVGQGPALGEKNQTTEAATQLSLLKAPLTRTWLETWRRSQTPFPLLYPRSTLQELEARLAAHPQFS